MLLHIIEAVVKRKVHSVYFDTAVVRARGMVTKRYDRWSVPEPSRS
jgi:hypothetical protein